MILRNKAKKSFVFFVRLKLGDAKTVRMFAGHLWFMGGKSMNSDLLESNMQCSFLIQLARFTVAILLFSSLSISVAAQTSDAQASQSESWTKTTESHPAA